MNRWNVGHVLEGAHTAGGLRLAIAAARFNQLVVDPLVQGAADAWHRAGGATADLHLAWAPGAFELPLVAQKLGQSGRYDAVVCLGAIIRGGTPHFDYVAGQAASGIAQAGLVCGIPIVFGVLTCDTVEQALDRAGLKSGNKGSDAVMAAIETARLMQQIATQTASKNHAPTR